MSSLTQSPRETLRDFLAGCAAYAPDAEFARLRGFVRALANDASARGVMPEIEAYLADQARRDEAAARHLGTVRSLLAN